MFRLFLAVAGVALVWSLTNTSAAQPFDAAPPLGRWPAEVKGYGLDHKKAQQNAYEAAARRLAVHLQAQNPPLLDDVAVGENEPLDPDVQRRLVGYVKKYLADGPGKAGDDVVGPDKTAIKTWALPFKDDPTWPPLFSAEQAAQRAARAEARQRLTGRGVAVLAAALLLGFGYVRLDEWTRRRYTSWLRVAAVVVVGALGVGWLLY